MRFSNFCSMVLPYGHTGTVVYNGLTLLCQYYSNWKPPGFQITVIPPNQCTYQVQSEKSYPTVPMILCWAILIFEHVTMYVKGQVQYSELVN